MYVRMRSVASYVDTLYDIHKALKCPRSKLSRAEKGFRQDFGSLVDFGGQVASKVRNCFSDSCDTLDRVKSCRFAYDQSSQIEAFIC